MSDQTDLDVVHIGLAADEQYAAFICHPILFHNPMDEGENPEFYRQVGHFLCPLYISITSNRPIPRFWLLSLRAEVDIPNSPRSFFAVENLEPSDSECVSKFKNLSSQNSQGCYRYYLRTVALPPLIFTPGSVLRIVSRLGRHLGRMNF